MALNVDKELAALRRMTPKQLREKYADVFGEESRSNHKAWLVKRIIWRLQANAEGDLSERARRRALEIANDADLRLKPPAPRKETPVVAIPIAAHPAGDRLPIPGTVLTRPYKGQTVRVTVLAAGFEYQGQVYRSLSAVAKAVTGTHTNGYLFFRLGAYAEASA